MALDISSALWRIGRAEELLKRLDSKVLAWMDTKPYKLNFNLDEKCTRASLTVVVTHKPAIVDWSLDVADIIHNLRCSLDNLVWAVAVHEANGGVPNVPKNFGFPIWDTTPNSNERKKIAALSPHMRAIIESVQPYSRPYPSLPVHPLSILRNIDNANKHKLLQLAFPSMSQGKILVVTGDDVADPPEHRYYTGEIHDTTEVVVTTFRHPHPNMKYEIESFSTIIALRHPVADPQGRDRDDYSGLLALITRIVRITVDTVLSAVK